MIVYSIQDVKSAGTVLLSRTCCDIISLASTLGQMTTFADEQGARMMRYLVALVALAIVIVRAVWPDARLDEISLVLLVVAALALVWPDIVPLTSRIRRFKVWGLEVELMEEISQLTERTEVAAREVSLERESMRPGAAIAVPPGVTQWLADAAADPRSGLLLVTIEIEQAIRRLAAQHGIAAGVGRVSARRALRELATSEAVPREVVPLFEDFWQVRNRVVHGVGFQLPAGQLYELVDVGFRILELLSLGERVTVDD
jgi:predicted membrane protein